MEFIKVETRQHEEGELIWRVGQISEARSMRRHKAVTSSGGGQTLWPMKVWRVNGWCKYSHAIFPFQLRVHGVYNKAINSSLILTVHMNKDAAAIRAVDLPWPQTRLKYFTSCSACTGLLGYRWGGASQSKSENSSRKVVMPMVSICGGKGGI